MAQRFEKVAQRRVEERNEKLKDLRKTRFDMRLNPFFSRPLESVAKEIVRQQQTDQKKVQQSSPTHPMLLIPSNEPITSYTQFQNYPNKKVKKLRYFLNDDEGESGVTTTTIKRSCLKSSLTRPISTTTDATMIRSIESLKLIYPAIQKTKYQHLFLIDQIAYIYIQLVVMLGHKTMTGGQFRNFAK